jgi:hypothetical protein
MRERRGAGDKARGIRGRKEFTLPTKAYPVGRRGSVRRILNIEREKFLIARSQDERRG